jgi:hypothetical protein
MWFRKQSAHGAPGSTHGGDSKEYLISEDMLVRGTISLRRGKPIRQIGVTVQGSTVMVTTGDTVSQEVYDALAAVGAIATPDAPAPRQDSPGSAPTPHEGQG